MVGQFIENDFTKISCFMEEFNQSDNINRELAQRKSIKPKTANETLPQSKSNNGKNSPAWFNSAVAKIVQNKHVGVTSQKTKRLTWENCVNSLHNEFV